MNKRLVSVALALLLVGCPSGNERIADVWDTVSILTEAHTGEVVVVIGEIVFFPSGEGIWYIPNRVEDTTPESLSYTITGDTVRISASNTFGVATVNRTVTMTLDGTNLMTGESTTSWLENGIVQNTATGIEEFTR